MERHRCKLCSRSFANGRALGGHMKAHLATLPLPPKPQQLADRTESASSSSSSSVKSKTGKQRKRVWLMGQRERDRVKEPNSPAIQAESETGCCGDSESELAQVEKTQFVGVAGSDEFGVGYFSGGRCCHVPDDAFEGHQDEKQRGEQDHQERSAAKTKEPEELEEIKIRRVRGKHRCEKCRKTFRSYQALGSHKTICYRDEAGHDGNERIFECPFCDKVFGSGQALGGHKRSHLLGSSTTTAAAAANAAAAAAAAASASASASAAASSLKFEISVIDLNLPAPAEEDDFSVVSDA
ncbi:hypothetical protein SLA2020_382420 [Shorea laevis]